MIISRHSLQIAARVLFTIALVTAVVFACLPLSVQAITLPALSKAWKQWAQEELRAEERTLEQVERVWHGWGGRYFNSLYVPLWAAQQHQPGLSDAQKRRF